MMMGASNLWRRMDRDGRLNGLAKSAAPSAVFAATNSTATAINFFCIIISQGFVGSLLDSSEIPSSAVLLFQEEGTFSFCSRGPGEEEGVSTFESRFVLFSIL